ncbi:MAG: 5-methylcytosine restriction system specificity protein McrC, partial [archaeon]
RYRDIIPDIYLENKNTGKVTIIDTKNKNYSNRKVNNGDIYQMAFYGMYISDYFDEATNVCIIYPKYIDIAYNQKKLFLNSYRQKNDSPSIKVKGLDINKFLQLIQDERKNYEQVKAFLHEKIVE